MLYAVGAAATTFSVEHEEETYGFLVRLPATWPALFAGKLVVALSSALLLASCSTGQPAGYSVAPPLPMAQALANRSACSGSQFSKHWPGARCSRSLIKRPLLAAIITLIVGTSITTMAVNFNPHNTMASLSPAAYYEASAPQQ